MTPDHSSVGLVRRYTPRFTRSPRSIWPDAGSRTWGHQRVPAAPVSTGELDTTNDVTTAHAPARSSPRGWALASSLMSLIPRRDRNPIALRYRGHVRHEEARSTRSPAPAPSSSASSSRSMPIRLRHGDVPLSCVRPRARTSTDLRSTAPTASKPAESPRARTTVRWGYYRCPMSTVASSSLESTGSVSYRPPVGEGGGGSSP